MSGVMSGVVDEDRAPDARHSEQVLLGAMLQHPADIIPVIRELRLRPEHLWRADHQKVLTEAFSLDDRGVVPTVSLIREALGDKLDGGHAYLCELSDHGIRLPGKNIREHIDRIQATWAARQQWGAMARYKRELCDDPSAALNGGPTRLAESLDDIRREVMQPSDSCGPLVDDVTLLTGREPEALVDGRIPAGGFVVGIGPPGTGKTFLSLDLALSVATGRHWLDVKVGRPGPVIYIAADGAGLKARVHAWKSAHGYRDDEPLGMSIWNEPVNFLGLSGFPNAILGPFGVFRG